MHIRTGMSMWCPTACLVDSTAEREWDTISVQAMLAAACKACGSAWLRFLHVEACCCCPLRLTSAMVAALQGVRMAEEEPTPNVFGIMDWSALA